MPVMRGAVSARVDVCYFCGEPARVDAAGISNHLTEDEEIDHDADADHVAVIEPECCNSAVAHSLRRLPQSLAQRRLNGAIFRAINVLLRINARLYGRGASYEVCRDLAGMWRSE